MPKSLKIFLENEKSFERFFQSHDELKRKWNEIFKGFLTKNWFKEKPLNYKFGLRAQHESNQNLD